MQQSAVIVGHLIKELDQIDVEYDYYEFEDEDAQEMFIIFCTRHNIDCEVVPYYSAKTESTGTCLRVPFSLFENTIAEINEDLEGNVPHPVTKEFLSQLMK